MEPERWNQVKELYEAALAREPELRSAFLAEVCAKDSALLSEVESLLRSNQEAGSFLAATALKSSAVDECGPEIGQRIGSYKLVCEIGHGGMGTVYLAHRADEIYHKRVAIKLIKRGMDTESILRRFKNERQILASLEHPNIARLLDGGTTEDGLPYFVMEWVEGQPLYEHCDSHKLPIIERLKLFRTICSAVHYAHQNLIVHRDLKPKNIIVTSDGVPKLLDFGIAKLLNPELSSQTMELTGSAVRLMTPEYASPEQFRGEPVTPATDVYSLGVLLYELLTGHYPYRSKSRFPEQMAELVCEEEPEKPSTVISRVEPLSASQDGSSTAITPESVSNARDGSPEQLRRRLKGDLDNIVLKSIHKLPKDRYASVEQISEDIRRHLEGLPIIARKAALSYRIGKFVRRHRISGLAIGLLVLAVGAGGFYQYLRPGSPNKVRSLVVLPFVNVTANPDAEYLSDGIADGLINSFSEIPELRVIARATAFRYKGKELDFPALGHQLSVDGVLSGRVQQVGDTLVIQADLVDTSTGSQLWGEQYNRPLTQALRIQEEITKAIAEKLWPRLAPDIHNRVTRRYTDNSDAYQLYLRGRFFLTKYTKEGFIKSREYFQRAIELDSNYALAYSGLADSYALAPQYTDQSGREAYAQARLAALKALALDDQLAEAHVSFGLVSALSWDWANVEKEYKRAIELSPNHSRAHHNYGGYLSVMGRYEEALAEIKMAQRLDPANAVSTSNMGGLLCQLGQYERGIAAAKFALALNPNFSSAYSQVAACYLRQKKYPEAIAVLKEARTLNLSGPEILGRLGFAYGRSGNRHDALSVLEELKSAVETDDGALIRIAEVFVALDDRESAFDWLEKAYQRRALSLRFLKTEFPFDPLHSDSRFKDLLQRVGLPP
jgi:eukaryotic-like serine/threonine-protein kinase